MIESPAETWVAGRLALALLAVDPAGLGGLHLRARAGPVRDAFLRELPDGLPPVRRVAPGTGDDALFGGVDLGATLETGRIVRSAGILARPVTLILAMAERCPAGLAARLGQALDARAGHAAILLDEGADPEEAAPTAMAERLAFRFDLSDLRAADMASLPLDTGAIDAARRALPRVSVPDDALRALAVTAARFGIGSMRAPLMALAAARAHTALMGRTRLGDKDLQLAVQLVYAHRATMLPDSGEDSADPPPPSDAHADTDPDAGEDRIPDEMLVAALAAVLPDGLLAALKGGRGARSARGSAGAGARKVGTRRGRPLPARPGKPRDGQRIDVIVTLRAAAPWQKLRRTEHPTATGILIRPTDIHVRRHEERTDRLVVFAVDASGSAAMARLAEAKGAVELMLADAYSSRDHVALIAFRGDRADLVLPPTRSLVQTKRRLAGLPGGGGTPLAAGLQAAHALMHRARGQGLSPSLALLTDGRANVPLPGRTGRVAAAEDASAMAGLVASLGLPSVVVDTGMRPTRALSELAVTLGATYLPLPRADSAGLSRAVGAALAG